MFYCKAASLTLDLIFSLSHQPQLSLENCVRWSEVCSSFRNTSLGVWVGKWRLHGFYEYTSFIDLAPGRICEAEFLFSHIQNVSFFMFYF